MIHPEFEPCPEGRILDALGALLSGDPANRGFFRREIRGIDGEALHDNVGGEAPRLLYMLRGSDDVVSGSAQQTDLQTLVEIVIITSHDGDNHDDHLRARLVHHQKRLLLQNRGVLLDVVTGESLTEALTRFQQVRFDSALENGLLATHISVLYRSTTDQTRELDQP